MKKATKAAFGTASMAAMLAAAAFGAGPAAADPAGGPPASSGKAKTVTLTAQLSELNDSGVSGAARAVVLNQLIRQIDVHADRLTPAGPHAQHIHYGDEARNECPSLFADDTDGDGLLSTVEGQPAYGPIVVSLTTSGDTSPNSALAVSRYPSGASYHYSRSMIEFTSVSGTGYSGGTGTAKQIADSIREGEGVVVIHGVDHNGNGSYDGEPSELDPALPREATDPAACGILR